MPNVPLQIPNNSHSNPAKSPAKERKRCWVFFSTQNWKKFSNVQFIAFSTRLGLWLKKIRRFRTFAGCVSLINYLRSFFCLPSSIWNYQFNNRNKWFFHSKFQPKAIFLVLPRRNYVWRTFFFFRREMGNLRSKNCYGSFSGARAKITPRRYLEVTSELKTAIIGFGLLLRHRWGRTKKGELWVAFFRFQCLMMMFFGKLMGRFMVISFKVSVALKCKYTHKSTDHKSWLMRECAHGYSLNEMILKTLELVRCWLEIH